MFDVVKHQRLLSVFQGGLDGTTRGGLGILFCLFLSTEPGNFTKFCTYHSMNSGNYCVFTVQKAKENFSDEPQKVAFCTCVIHNTVSLLLFFR